MQKAATADYYCGFFSPEAAVICLDRPLHSYSLGSDCSALKHRYMQYRLIMDAGKMEPCV